MRQFLPLLSVAIVAALSLPAMAHDAQNRRIVSIDGKGEVTTAPDTAFVNAGVTTSAKTAREALTGNTTAMAALIATLKDAGIAPADIQTSGFSVNPEYANQQPDKDGNVRPPQVTGYRVTNGVAVTVRKLDELGADLDRIVSAGSNTINGISFSVDDPDELMEEARKAAFADAQAKARTYANAAGVGLGPVLSITEGGGDGPRPVGYADLARVKFAAAAPVPVEAGQLTYAVNVSVQWELRGGE